MGLDPITGVGGLIYGAVKLLDWMRPDVPNIKTPQQRARAQGGSPNNQLGRRSNEARPEQRIPYILGNVRSVPDMLMVPYTVYENHVEVEYGYYCVGQGSHVVSDIRDGDSLLSQIEGATAEVYGPGKAPTGGIGLHDPELTIGEPIADDVYVVYEVEAVNGQELSAFNDFTFYGSLFPNNSEHPLFMAFFDNGDGTGRIDVPFASAPDEITDRVELGDQLFIFWPMAHIPPGGVGAPPDLTTPETSSLPVVVATPEVVTINVPPDPLYVELTVNIPVSQQPEWALLQTYFEDLQDPGDLFPYTGATFEFAEVTPLSHLYVGPIFVDFEHPLPQNDFEIVCNFVAPRGLFADDGVTIRKMDVEIQVIITPADSSGNPDGPPQAFQGTLAGSATARGQRALTLRCQPVGLTSTRVLVQARRLTPTYRRTRLADNVEVEVYGADLEGDPDADPPVPPRFAHFSGTVVDEIRWTHCYSMTKPPNISFGDVTTIHTRTVATRGALRVKDRQLNCLATRMIQSWNGTTFGGSLVATDRSQNVLFTVLKDPTIGGLADANIDFAGIAAAFEQVRQSVFSKFPTPLGDATRFSYTFDDADLSLEETIQAICQAAFCVAYRDGDVIKVRPELATCDSVLLLNHRNTIQGSQKITHTFGKAEENDSVEVSYVDPSDDSNTKVVVPKHFSGIRKTRQIKVVGLRSSLQAYWHAYRAYHKMLYQRQSMTIEATAEAEILGTRQRVLVANETKSGAQTGEILAIVSPGDRVLTSQPVTLAPGVEYRIHLQHPDGTVYDRRIITAVSSRELQLAGSLADVITDPGAGVRTTYLILHPEQPEPSAFLISSTQPSSDLRHQIEAVNHSNMYYLADGLTVWVDFANGLSDLSPQQRLFTNNGGTITDGEWQGEPGDYFEVLDPTEDEQTANYTKLLWITASSAPTDSGLIRTDSGGDEAFEITPGDLIVAGHGAVDVSAEYSTFTAAEHMVAVTYDAVDERMALFIDGSLVDDASVAPATTGSPLRYLEGFEGSARMVMKWGRALTDCEIREIYLRTRLAAPDEPEPDPEPEAFMSVFGTDMWQSDIYSPRAQYYSDIDKTIITWFTVGTSGYKNTYVAAYDHSTEEWSSRVTAGNFLLANDTHGKGSLLRDADGYFHIFHGSHNNTQQWSVSNAPNDISAWTRQTALTGQQTYPHPVLIGSTIYLFLRPGTAGTDNRYLSVRTLTPSAGLGTFSARTDLVDFDTDSRAYPSAVFAVGTEVHAVLTRSNGADTEDKNLYYLRYDTVTGSVSNHDSSVTVGPGSLPVALTQMNSDFRIYDHGSLQGDVPAWCFDANGDPHVLFTEGTGGAGSPYDIRHITRTSGTWSSPTTLATITDLNNLSFNTVYSILPGPVGTVEAWYMTDNGDKVRRIRSSGGVWGSPQVILAVGAELLLGNTAVRDAHPDLRVLFNEREPGPSDSGAITSKHYAYGDSGFIQAAIPQTPADPSFSSVSLLLGFESRDGLDGFINDAPTGFIVTANGNAQADTAQSKFGASSLRLDGSGDYLSVSHNSLLSVSNGDLTIECWVRRNGASKLQAIAGKRNTTNTSEYVLWVRDTDLLQLIVWNTSGSVVNITSTDVITNTGWHHVEADSSGGTWYLFVDGVLQGSSSQSAAPTSNTEILRIGRDPVDTGRDFNGWIDEFRFTSGVARHTASFTPPASPFPRI